MLSSGFASKVIYWFRSYVSSRKFHVDVNEKSSTFADLRCRVPQEQVMALKVINKVNGWLKFPYRKNRFKNIFKKPLIQCYNSTTF